jgi:hypothetical protein
MQAAQAAQADRQSRREENDLWVTGGVNWGGYGLESLIKMVAERAHPGQLEALAQEWKTHGAAVNQSSDDLQRALNKVMQFWGGQASDAAVRNVMTNARWIGELGTTAQNMYDPIMNAAGALRSAQSTMPGMPKNAWWATAGGGAAAGFAVGGPIGAAFGAALGGIASAFGFGNKKKKMKRKAVQTMERYESALLGIDQTTPQFPGPSDGANPGDPLNPRPVPPPIDLPDVPVVPPSPGPGVVKPSPAPADGNFATDPSFSFGPDARWQSLTGGGGGGSLPGGGGGGGGFGLGTGPFGTMPPGMAGRGGATAGRGGVAGRGAGAMGGPAGRGGGGAGARGAGSRGAGGRAGAGVPGGGMGGAGGRGDRDYRGRGRFSKTGAFGPGGAPGGRRQEDEEDGEHRRRVPIEEDPFTSDLKAAPPVIGI